MGRSEKPISAIASSGDAHGEASEKPVRRVWRMTPMATSTPTDPSRVHSGRSVRPRRASTTSSATRGNSASPRFPMSSATMANRTNTVHAAVRALPPATTARTGPMPRKR